MAPGVLYYTVFLVDILKKEYMKAFNPLKPTNRDQAEQLFRRRVMQVPGSRKHKCDNKVGTIEGYHTLGQNPEMIVHWDSPDYDEARVAVVKWSSIEFM